MIIADSTGRVLEQWTGFQVAWTMARGYPGAFGGHVNALYVWLPLCVLFLLPFIDFRRPFSLLHLDLLVLLSFSVSLAFFNHAHIYASVPLAYPPLLYLLARMLALLRRRRRARAPAPQPCAAQLRLLVPRALAGARGRLPARLSHRAQRHRLERHRRRLRGRDRRAADRDGEPLYGDFRPTTNTATPTARSTTRPTSRSSRSSAGAARGTTCPPRTPRRSSSTCSPRAAVPARPAHARPDARHRARLRVGRPIPFTLFALESNTNDTLVAALVLAALLAASYRSSSRRRRAGALAALAGLTKFAPLALAPLLATHGLREPRRARAPACVARRSRSSRSPSLARAAVVSIPALAHDSLHTIYERTLVYQANRGSPFSVWGLYGAAGPAGSSSRRRRGRARAGARASCRAAHDVVGLAAACAAVMIAVQLGIEHWFYLYIPWFFPLVMLALLGRHSDPAWSPAAGARHQHLLDRVRAQPR